MTGTPVLNIFNLIFFIIFNNICKHRRSRATNFVDHGEEEQTKKILDQITNHT